MIPYIIFFGLLLLSWYYRKPEWMLFLIIIFSILRFNTGWDYASYIDSISTFHRVHPENTRFSMLWQLLFVFVNKINSPHIAIAIPNVITYICVWIACKMYFKDDKRGISNALLFYALWPFFYLASWSTLRQQLAVAIGLVCLCCLNRKKYIISAILLYIAYLAHPSSLVLILFVPAVLFKRLFNLKFTLIISAIAAAALSAISVVMQWLAVSEFDRYEVYFNMENNFGGKLIFLQVAMFIWLCFACSKNKNNPWAKNDFYRLCLGLSIAAIAAQMSVFFFGSSNIISRITTYFSSPLTLVMFRTFDGFKQRILNRQVFTIALCALFFVYLYSTTGKGSEAASSPFVPYNCILFK